MFREDTRDDKSRMNAESLGTSRADLDVVAQIVSAARGCDDSDSAKTTTGSFPCPFCYWDDDPSHHESGCYFWAEKILKAVSARESSVPGNTLNVSGVSSEPIPPIEGEKL